MSAQSVLDVTKRVGPSLRGLDTGGAGLTVATSHFVDLFVMPRKGPGPAGRSRVLYTLSTPAGFAGLVRAWRGGGAVGK